MTDAPPGAALLTNEGIVAPPRRRDNSAVIAAISNLSIQYNFQSAAIALAIMDDKFPTTAAEKALLKSFVFAGAIIGQLVMGYAGDAIGRRYAMVLTNMCTLLGAAGSALFPWGPPRQMYTVLMVCRFVLGVGVGGKYPLSAVIRSEACDDTAARPHSATQVALSFFWQTPGSMLPYVVALLALHGFGSSASSEAAASTEFRLILGLGALPAVVVTALCWWQPESNQYTQARQRAEAESQSARADAAPTEHVADGRARPSRPEGRRWRQWLPVSSNPLAVALRHREHWRRLLGTGLSWMIYDFVYYGTRPAGLRPNPEASDPALLSR